MNMDELDEAVVTLTPSRIEAAVAGVIEALGVDNADFPEEALKGACEAVLEALLPKKTGYLTIKHDAIEAVLFHESGMNKRKSRALIRNREELMSWCRKWGVDNFMCSSSIDFPEDETDNQTVIALCRELRS